MPFKAANSQRLAIRKIGTSTGDIVIVCGLILLLIGFVTGITAVWTIGMIVLVVGLVLWLLGAMGHAIGGRRHYY
jgi:fatty-acid desaturase